MDQTDPQKVDPRSKNFNKNLPEVPTYGPSNLRNLKPGQLKLWCTCGLSKKQPWCDGSHKNSGFSPVKWRVPDGDKKQSLFSICNCKYTRHPPFCDGSHIDTDKCVPCRFEGYIKVPDIEDLNKGFCKK